MLSVVKAALTSSTKNRDVWRTLTEIAGSVHVTRDWGTRKNSPNCFSIILLLAFCPAVLTFDLTAVNKGETFKWLADELFVHWWRVFRCLIWLWAAVWVQEGSGSMSSCREKTFLVDVSRFLLRILKLPLVGTHSDSQHLLGTHFVAGTGQSYWLCIKWLILGLLWWRSG